MFFWRLKKGQNTISFNNKCFDTKYVSVNRGKVAEGVHDMYQRLNILLPLMFDFTHVWVFQNARLILHCRFFPHFWGSLSFIFFATKRLDISSLFFLSLPKIVAESHYLFVSMKFLPFKKQLLVVIVFFLVCLSNNNWFDKF